MKEGNLPLRTVLQNFINHVDSLEADEINGDLHENEFQELKKFTEDLKGNRDYSTTEGERDCSRRKNRYKDILPYDYSRVVLQDIPGVPGSDYVNANYIRGASGSRAYIASQGPLPHTVSEFWRLVVECDVQVIVMASNETEGGKHKCECYWVSVQGEEKQFGNVQVTYIKSRQVCPDFLVRTFKIKYPTEKNKKEERIICQFHYILWPDHGIPDSVKPLLDMVRLVRDCQASETLPVLVHCSAGCGRTGTICAIDYVWGLLRTGKLNQHLDLFGLVKEMRQQRVAMVQTREQYVLLHQAVKELFKERLKLIDAHPYENVSTDGNPIIPTEKESDYEELFVSSEKQDKSSKVKTANSSVSESQVARFQRDSIHKSSSTSSLDSCNIVKPNYAQDRMNPLQSTSSQSQCTYQSITKEPHSSNGNPFKTHQAALQNSTDYIDKVIPERRKYSKPSKMEKDAENFAQLAKEKVILGQQSQPISKLIEKSIYVPFIAEDLPIRARRSRTPSPKTISQLPPISLDSGRIHTKSVSEIQSNGSEFSRRANIQKLKEVFESSSPSGSRVVKLTRSASSVSIRPNFSVANTSRDFEDLEKYSPSISKNVHGRNLLICPPPPTDPIPEHWKIKRSLTALSLPSSKQPNNFHNTIQPRYDKPTRQDERPILPIKKSKSFRWSRQDQNNSLGERVEVRKPLSHPQPNRLNKVDHDVNLDVPSVKEKFKLSVYQGSSDVSSSSSSSATDIHNFADNKPVVPPKKTIGERYKSFKMQHIPLSTNSQAASNSTSERKAAFSRINQPFLEDRRNKASVGTQMYPNEFALKEKKKYAEAVVDHGPEKGKSKKNPTNSYVNAKVVKSVGEDHYSYVPLPSKRSGRLRNPYVNYNVLGLDPTVRTAVVNKTDQAYFENKRKSDSRLGEDENFIVRKSPSFQPDKVNSQQSSNPESVDFGEAFNISNDVFETVNYELVNAKPDSTVGAEAKDFYLNKDLDTIAKQVYKDCEAYLFSRDNSSPVPSLLPKQNPVESDSKINSANKSQNKNINSSELEHVINKIAVAPQGLRNRERRNSYRQAVNPANSGSKTMETRHPRNIHKYERIWFENDEKNPSSRNRVFQESASSGKITNDFSSNMNKEMNISNKDSLFKDKLEEIHLMMNDIERKHLQYLPDLSEEELSSKHSSSTSSLVSRSGQSSRSSERAEPVYVNTSGAVKPPMYLSSEEPRSGQYAVTRKRSELDTHAMGGASHYGTLATTTSFPYRTTRVPSYGQHHNAGKVSTINPYTATLPLRSAANPPDNNVLYTPSIYRKTLTQPVQKPKNPLQVYQCASKNPKSMPSSVRSPPVLHQKDQSVRKRDPLKRMDQPIKPSEVHRKRQQLNAKESFFKPSDLPLLQGSNPLQQSMSTPFFQTSQKPNRNLNDAAESLSERVDHAGSNLISKKKSSKDLNCVSSTALSDSSLEDSSADDDGVFVKFAPANILKKFRTAQVSTSKFYGKEEPSDTDYQQPGEISPMSPSASPKTFTKAFDKIKIGSKNVAANFKSYIKGDKIVDEDAATKSENSSTSNIQSFGEVKDYKYPLSIPKKPQGTREIPSNFTANPTTLSKKSKQQYL